MASASSSRRLLGAVSVLSLLSQAESFFGAGPSAATGATSSNPPPVPSKIDRAENPQWIDALKYDGEPTFDVLQRTIDFSNEREIEGRNRYFDPENYVFRGSIVGPISFEEVWRTQQGFQVFEAYSDFEARPFGFTVDPDNPYRCYYFERWEGTNTGELKIGPLTAPPTGEQVQLPTHMMSLNWTPEGKIIYACVSPPLDRFEGTTKGVGAVFGLLAGGGLKAGGTVGDAFFRFQQRFFQAIGGFGRSWSPEEEIPSWWKSKSRGADPTDL
uniref:Uncharacterized protein n=1 Tax=Odontella aurita TaxID=265563 RepID=A0A7S4N828_9STRA|mmetsp:Transcript_51501/g.154614  ORF Transcript_51501/g.154614 Transcript_51501/m.154614 type:complete len:271 (+) Transcript_51501:122-934(+)